MVKILIKRGANLHRRKHIAFWDSAYYSNNQMIELLVSRYSTSELQDLKIISPNSHAAMIVIEELQRRHFKKILKDTPEIEI